MRKASFSKVEIFRIRPAARGDEAALSRMDPHIGRKERERALLLRRIYVAERAGRVVGCLRYNLFWDNTPFLNLLYVEKDFRGRGVGGQLLRFFEEKMRARSYSAVMTSTQAAESARYFYASQGYTIVGGFWPEGEGYELLLSKTLDGKTAG